jgi:hypothetical protein
MENNKYYTPDISEFHVCFEYEKYDKRIAVYVNIGPTNWHKHEYHTRDIKISNLGIYLNEGSIRVKYLDREDIESLNFTNYKKAAADWYELEGHFEDSFASYGYWTKIKLIHYKHGIKILAYEYTYNEEPETLFAGIVNNKSELIKLLKQLNIK